MKNRIHLVLISIVCMGCFKDQPQPSPIHVEQNQYLQGVYDLCTNDQIDFDHYIFHADASNDSVQWFHYSALMAEWEYFGTGNPMDVPVSPDYSMIQRFEFHNGDTVFGLNEIFQCYRFISIPTSFTPNGDGINEEWKPIVVEYPETLTSYYNRITTSDGVVLFETGNPEVGWNGTYNGERMPAGPYLYYIKLEYEDLEDPVEYSGVLSLVL